MNIYLDGSMSMQGFVADQQDSEYVTVLRKIREGATGYPLNLYKFSDNFSAQHFTSKPFSPAVFTRNFYDQVNTSLTGLLTYIASNMSTGAVSLVVSDMVQSQAGTDSVSVAQALQQMLQAQDGVRPEILLLGFRSKFQGTYYVEAPLAICTPRQGETKREKRKREAQCQRQRKFDLNLDNEQSRPFYVLVIAPSAEIFSQVNDAVLKELRKRAPASFQPTDPPLVMSQPKLSRAPDLPDHWNRDGRLFPREQSGPRTPLIFFDRRTSSGKVSPLRLEVEVQTQTPAASLANALYRVEHTTFRLNEVGRWEPPAPLEQVGADEFQITTEEKAGKVVLTYPFPRPSPGTWDLYRIKFQVRPSNAQAPAWVDEWSTDDDRTAENGNRTLGLKVLVETMARTITKDLVFADQCILLGRGR